MKKSRSDTLDRDRAEALGRRLRARRTELGLGLIEVSERSELPEGRHLSHSYLSRLERGLVARPTVTELRAAAQGYGLSLSAMLGEDDQGTELELARALARHPELAIRFSPIATGWEWLDSDGQAFALDVLDAVAAQARRAVDGQARERPPEPRRRP